MGAAGCGKCDGEHTLEFPAARATADRVILEAPPGFIDPDTDTPCKPRSHRDAKRGLSKGVKRRDEDVKGIHGLRSLSPSAKDVKRIDVRSASPSSEESTEDLVDLISSDASSTASDMSGSAFTVSSTSSSRRWRKTAKLSESEVFDHASEEGTFLIWLERPGPFEKLGVDCKELDDVDLLVVGLGKEGALIRWNENHPDHKLQVGDLVVGVNGVRGNSRHLLQRLLTDAALELTVRRASPPAPAEGDLN